MNKSTNLIFLIVVVIGSLLLGYFIGEQTKELPDNTCSDQGICIGDTVFLTHEANESLSIDRVNTFRNGGIVKSIGFSTGVVIVEFPDGNKTGLNQLWLNSQRKAGS